MACCTCYVSYVCYITRLCVLLSGTRTPVSYQFIAGAENTFLFLNDCHQKGDICKTFGLETLIDTQGQLLPSITVLHYCIVL